MVHAFLIRRDKNEILIGGGHMWLATACGDYALHTYAEATTWHHSDTVVDWPLVHMYSRYRMELNDTVTSNDN